MTDSQIKSLLVGRTPKSRRIQKVVLPDAQRETLGYARYSSKSSQTELTIDKQTEMIQAHCASKGWRTPRMFSDKGKTGKNALRSGWTSLLAQVRPGTRVVVHESSRFAREAHTFLGMMKDVKRKGGSLDLVVGKSNDTMFLTIMAAVSEAEYRSLNEHMRDGRMQAIANGKPYRIPPMGYRKVDQYFQIDKTQMKWVRKIFEMRLARASTIDIVAYLVKKRAATAKGGKWTVNMVVKILTSPIYAGYLITKRPVFEWEDNY